MERRLAGTLASVLLLILGLACTGFLLYNLAKDLSIWVLGKHTVAEVVELWVVRTSGNEEGELTFDYYVRYRFSTPGGQEIIDASTLGVTEWGALSEGSPIEVVYFPLYPQHNRVDEARFVTLLACAYLPLAVFAWATLGVGWYMLQPSTKRSWWFSRSADL